MRREERGVRSEERGVRLVKLACLVVMMVCKVLHSAVLRLTGRNGGGLSVISHHPPC